MQQNGYFNEANTKQVIEENKKWFNFFVVFPKVSTIVFATLFFVLGIIFGCIEDYFVVTIVFWGGGAVISVLNYVLLKLALSYQILHIYYLENISNNISSSTNKTEERIILPEI